MQALRARTISVWKSSPFLRHVVTLMSGTAGAQVIVMLMMMMITRLYSRETFGEFGVYTSVLAAIVPLAAARYDMAVMLEKEDNAARKVLHLGFVCISVTAVGTTIVFILLEEVLTEYYSERLASWLPLLGLSIFFLASATLLQFWFNRAMAYKTIALNRIQQQIGSTGGQVGFGYFGVSTLGGLIVGQLIGFVVSLAHLAYRASSLWKMKDDTTVTIRGLGVKHWRMPLLNGPNVLVDAARNLGIPLLIGAVSLGSLAEYRVAEAAVTAPVALFTGAISQVFFQKLSQVEPGQMYIEVKRAVFRALLVGVSPFVALYLVAPWLLPLLFGHQYSETGYFARALIPWLFMTVVTSPISNMFIVTGKQGWLLGFAVVYTAAPLSWLYYSPYDLLTTVQILGIIMATCLSGMVILAFLAARAFDARAGR